jgi:hypothetical protein
MVRLMALRNMNRFAMGLKPSPESLFLSETLSSKSVANGVPAAAVWKRGELVISSWMHFRQVSGVCVFCERVSK